MIGNYADMTVVMDDMDADLMMACPGILNDKMLAEVLWELLMGHGPQVVEEEEYKDCMPVVKYGLVEKRDWEVEKRISIFVEGLHGMPERKYMWVDGACVSQPYFTRSGDRPVCLPEAETNDLKRSVGGWSDIWASSIVSEREPGFTDEQVKEIYGNYRVVVDWVAKHKDDKQLLRRGWGAFWKRIYKEKAAGTKHLYMWQKHINAVKECFGQYGIAARKKVARANPSSCASLPSVAQSKANPSSCASLPSVAQSKANPSSCGSVSPRSNSANPNVGASLPSVAR